MSATASDRWFLSLGDMIAGPLTWSEVEQRVHGAHAEDSACVRADGSEAWKPFKSAVPPSSEAAAPAPISGVPDSESVSFCETAVRIGVLTPDIAHQILEQRRVDRAIGYGKSIYAYLEEHHLLTVDQIAAVLAAQKNPAASAVVSVQPAAAHASVTTAPPLPKKPSIKFGTLFPVREWIAESPWSSAWVRWFAFFALFPVLVGQLLTSTTTLGDVIWALGAYFAVISGFVLYLWLRPENLRIVQILGVAGFTALAGGVLVLGSTQLPIIHQFYDLTKNPDFTSRALGSILGIGLVEEGVKAVPIYWLFIYKKKPVQLRTCAFLAAVSGLAFGVLEAVNYSYLYATMHAKTLIESVVQTGGIPQAVYAGYVVSQAARLVSLPLLHALFAALTGTFIGLAAAVAEKRVPLVLTGLGLAAVLHGLYDAALFEGDPSPWLALSVALVAVLLFTLYSHWGEKILERLRREQTVTAA